MKSKKKTGTRLDEDPHPHRTGPFSFLKSRLFSNPPKSTLDTQQSTAPPSASPRTSVSSHRSMTLPHRSPWSMDLPSESQSDPKARSYEDSLDNILPRRRPSSTAEDQKRTSLIVLKEGYLYKKTDFRAFHKASRLDRGWKLYRVVLRGHKLYLYKTPTESPLKSLFPLPKDHQPTFSLSTSSVSSVSQGRSSSSVLASSDSSITLGDSFDRDAQGIFMHGPLRKSFVYGAAFGELDRQTLAATHEVRLLLFASQVIVCRQSLDPKDSGVWQIDLRLPLQHLRLESLSCPKPTFALGLISQPAMRVVFESQTAERADQWIAAFKKTQQKYMETEWTDEEAISLEASWLGISSHSSENGVQQPYDGTQQHPGLLTYSTPAGKRIQGGSLEALVHELLLETQSTCQAQGAYLHCFLLTYTMFTTAVPMLDEIKAQLKRYANQPALQHRLLDRTLDIFDVWCRSFGQDVVGEVATGIIGILDILYAKTLPALQQRSKRIKGLILATLAQNGAKNDQEAMSAWNDVKLVYTIAGHTTDAVELAKIHPNGLVPSLFLSMNPEQFAEQIYMFHYSQQRTYRQSLTNPLSFLPGPQIPTQMLNSLLFTTASPHFLTRLIRRQILIDTQQHNKACRTERSMLIRTQLIEHWVRVGRHLLILGDMSGWAAVAMGLCSVGVVRLKESWKSVDRILVTAVIEDWVPLLAEHGLFSQEVWVDGWEGDQSREFSAILESPFKARDDLPSLPFFGTLKQTVDRMRKHVKEHLSYGTIHFAKYWSIFDTIEHSLAGFKSNPVDTLLTTPPFDVAVPLQTYFETSVTDFTAVPHDYRYLQEASLGCEPRIFGQHYDRKTHDPFQSPEPGILSAMHFPEILESHNLFKPTEALGLSLQASPLPDRTFQSIGRSSEDRLSSRMPGTIGFSVQGRSPRQTGSRALRRRTYSFPPGRITKELVDVDEGPLTGTVSSTSSWLTTVGSGPRNEWVWSVLDDSLVFKATLHVSGTRPNPQTKQQKQNLRRSRPDTLGSTDTLWNENRPVLQIQVKAASLDRLLDGLFEGVDAYADLVRDQWQSLLKREEDYQLMMDEDEFIRVFFVTYRTFVSCVHLLDLFRKRFSMAKLVGYRVRHQKKKTALETVFMPNEAEECDWQRVGEVQLRILDLMLYWVDEHFYDFVDEIEILRHIARFLKTAEEALDEWRLPLLQTSEPTDQALLIATKIQERMAELRTLFFRRFLSPCYDLKAIVHDTHGGRHVDELYRQLTNGTTQSFSTTAYKSTGDPIVFSLTMTPDGGQSVCEGADPSALLMQADRSVRPFFASVTLQDWIQTFDVFEAQSTDIYAWLPARKASHTSLLSAALSPVTEAPSAQQTAYNMAPEDIIVSDIFTAIEGARRSIVSPSAFSADDLLLAFPSSIQNLYCMHFVIRSWVMSQIAEPNIDLKTRIDCIDTFLRMATLGKHANETRMIFPEIKDPAARRVPGFVEYAIASALVSPEVRLYSRAWQEVALRHGQGSLDTLESMLCSVQEGFQPPVDGLLVPSLGWIFERMLELCAMVPNKYRQHEEIIYFDKRRYVFHFFNMLMNAQIDLEITNDQPLLSFMVAPNRNKPSWRDLKETAQRENKASAASRNSTYKHNLRSLVFGKSVGEQLDKLRRDIKERDRMDKECREVQHKLQKKQMEQLRQSERQGKRSVKGQSSQPLQALQLQHHSQMMPKINSFLRGLRPHSMTSVTLGLFPTDYGDTTMLSFMTTKAATVINLIHSTVSVASAYTKRDYVFRIVTEEGGQYLFQGTNRDDMHDWMKQINNAAREGAAKRQSVLVAESLDDQTSQCRVDIAGNSNRRSGHLQPRSSVYGVDLSSLMRGDRIPLVMEKCLKEIEMRGLEEIGIYRVAGTGSVVTKLKMAFNTQLSSVNLSDPVWADINVVADALKQFLRELPEPLLTCSLYDEFINASASENHDERVYLIRETIRKLPHANYIVLKRLIEHFVTVTDFEVVNHMYATNLAIVFGPTLLQPAPGPASFATTMSNLGHHQNIVKYLILKYHDLFDVESEEAEASTDLDETDEKKDCDSQSDYTP
ncbi:hypothetical protein CLU79DRAFT_717097 [Phycomyces nitens]|nr:hypothetical protein CLU79DRAFT_717097 [Phycomyces nitens]